MKPLLFWPLMGLLILLATILFSAPASAVGAARRHLPRKKSVVKVNALTKVQVRLGQPYIAELHTRPAKK